MSCQSWMAAQIAEGNATVIEYLQNVLTSENNANRLDQEDTFKLSLPAECTVRCSNWKGKLLLAA